jgi:hypothetical protein
MSDKHAYPRWRVVLDVLIVAACGLMIWYTLRPPRPRFYVKDPSTGGIREADHVG